MNEFEIRSTTESEDKYTYRQSSQISSQTGLIGYLRADMDSSGNGFFSTWNDYRQDLKTSEFKDEFDKVINTLRDEGYFLHNRTSLAKYCYSTPQARMKTEQEYYGVRLDTENYSYLMRLNPNKGEYNLYCFCYKRDWLDDHIRQAKRGIRFIDPNYVEKFRIADGEMIRITLSDGEQMDRTCRYIDDYHLEVGDTTFHICEFAERIEQNASTVIPLRSDLPDCCYSVNKVTGEIIILKKGEKGFFKTDIPTKGREESRELADFQNSKLGVTKAQEAAMYWGSLYGFDTPGADPKQFDAEGVLMKSKREERNER